MGRYSDSDNIANRKYSHRSPYQRVSKLASFYLDYRGYYLISLLKMFSIEPITHTDY